MGAGRSAKTSTGRPRDYCEPILGFRKLFRIGDHSFDIFFGQSTMEDWNPSLPSSRQKSRQSDFSAVSEYTRLSNNCYQSLLLESYSIQQNQRDDHAERLAALERELHRTSWWTHVTAFLTTHVSDAMNSEHGKRLGSVLTSSVWNDAWFCFDFWMASSNRSRCSCMDRTARSLFQLYFSIHLQSS